MAASVTSSDVDTTLSSSIPAVNSVDTICPHLMRVAVPKQGQHTIIQRKKKLQRKDSGHIKTEAVRFKNSTEKIQTKRSDSSRFKNSSNRLFRDDNNSQRELPRSPSNVTRPTTASGGTVPSLPNHERNKQNRLEKKISSRTVTPSSSRNEMSKSSRLYQFEASQHDTKKYSRPSSVQLDQMNGKFNHDKVDGQTMTTTPVPISHDFKKDIRPHTTIPGNRRVPSQDGSKYISKTGLSLSPSETLNRRPHTSKTVMLRTDSSAMESPSPDLSSSPDNLSPLPTMSGSGAHFKPLIHVEANTSDDESKDLADDIETEVLISPIKIQSLDDTLSLPEFLQRKHQHEAWAVAPSESLSDKDLSSQTSQSDKAMETWLFGSPQDSDEYDTDLEDDNDKVIVRPSVDDTGKHTYLTQCRRMGIVPISYLVRHIGDRNLKLRHHYLGTHEMIPVAMAMQHNTVTELVDLSDNQITADGIRYLAEMMHNNYFIVHLDLSQNVVGTRGLIAISDMLEANTTLKSLSLSGTHLLDNDMHYLIEPLKTNTSLSSLDLSYNQFGEMAGISLGAAVGVNEGLMELDLSWNSLRQKGALAIANALMKNITLETLDLSWNGFAQAGATALMRTLGVNSTLRVLDLSNNHFNSKAIQKLVLGLRKNTCLETLVLNFNMIGEDGMDVLLKMALVHPTLKYLSIETAGAVEVKLSAPISQRIQELEEARGMAVLHGGVGGYQRFSAYASVSKLLQHFLQANGTLLESRCRLQDKEGHGKLSFNELKHLLKETGLQLTGKQMDILLTEMDRKGKGEIVYGDLLSGKLVKRLGCRAKRTSHHGSSQRSERIQAPHFQRGLSSQVTVS